LIRSSTQDSAKRPPPHHPVPMILSPGALFALHIPTFYGMVRSRRAAPQIRAGAVRCEENSRQ
jgi:hypothetical protein